MLPGDGWMQESTHTQIISISILLLISIDGQYPWSIIIRRKKVLCARAAASSLPTQTSWERSLPALLGGHRHRYHLPVETWE